jgi:hypothetical protein
VLDVLVALEERGAGIQVELRVDALLAQRLDVALPVHHAVSYAGSRVVEVVHDLLHFAPEALPTKVVRDALNARRAHVDDVLAGIFAARGVVLRVSTTVQLGAPAGVALVGAVLAGVVLVVVAGVMARVMAAVVTVLAFVAALLIVAAGRAQHEYGQRDARNSKLALCHSGPPRDQDRRQN